MALDGDLRLLARIAPEFLKLAIYYTGNSKVALAARERLKLEPFYAKLHLEFKVLGEYLTGWDDSVEVSDILGSLIVRVLEVLESRFVKKTQFNLRATYTSSKYPRLRDLQNRIEGAEAEDSSLGIQQLRTMIHLEDKKKENRVRMVNRLTKCNRELGIVLWKTSITQKEYTFGAKASRAESHLEESWLPLYQTRNRATALYRTLAQNWKCEGHNPHTDTMIRLSTYLLLMHLSSGKRVRFCLYQGESHGSPFQGMFADRHLGRRATKVKAKAKAKTVTFSVPSRELSVSDIRPEDRWPVEGICKLVDDVTARTPCRMKLLLEHDKLWYLNPSPAIEEIQRKDQVSLGKFLELSSRSSQLVKKRDKLILQVILANSLLHLYRGPWLLKNLDKTRICFYKPRSQDIPDLTRPYLACRTDLSEELGNEEDVRFRIHPYPGILALGILLLQIELGRPIEEERPEDSPNRGGVLHIDADRPVAMEMLDECRDDSSVDFVQAIEACLDDKTFTDAFGQDASFDDPVFRQQIFELIVKPLETALLKIFGISVEKLDQLIAVVPRVARHQRRPAQSILPHVSVQSKLPRLVEGLKSISLGTAAVHINQEPHVCLYDDGQNGTISTQVASQVDKWFDILHQRVVQPLKEIDVSRGTAIPSCKVFKRSGRIRVAVLDTGLDLPEEAEWAYEDRIGGQRSWLSENERLGQILQKDQGDYDGHGTHATSLLLQVAPDVEIFVAQVFKDHKETSGKTMSKVIHQRIADAIRYAVEEWKVDIISMSFGFEHSVDVIDEAIRLADSNNVIMFAAASNQGGNSNIAWPARLPQVICIYATDSYGNRCDFTPTEATRGDNFAVLGQAVKSCWPPHLGQGGEVRKSGTSTATPIAAGIAAIVLDFFKSALPRWDRHLSEEDVRIFRKLMSSAGMSTVFRQMKRTRAGYDYIVPWDFLDPKKYQDSTVCDIILAELKAL
ncbi:hypothetical protein IFR05_005653 [Cadophora sp. M221]|nr:hypothetical protein IFR05_005653 [Cadophora sp. M221]